MVAVLAGGRGTRLGGAKAMVELDGAPLIERPLRGRPGGRTGRVRGGQARHRPAGRARRGIEPDEPSHPLVRPDHRARARAGDRRRLRPAVAHAGAAARAGRPRRAGDRGRARAVPGPLRAARNCRCCATRSTQEASLRATLGRLQPARCCGAAPRAGRERATRLRTWRPRASWRRDVTRADFAVVGGGIVGCALAAFLAEGGAEVTLYEREAIAAGASGRNSGVVQDPLDPALTGLYEESLGHYRDARGLRAAAEHPSGLLLVSDEPSSTERRRAASRTAQRLEPALAAGPVRAPARHRPPRPARGRRARAGAHERRSARGSEDRARQRRPDDAARRSHRRRPVDAATSLGARRSRPCGASWSTSSCPTRRGTCSKRPGSTRSRPRTCPTCCSAR